MMFLKKINKTIVGLIIVSTFLTLGVVSAQEQGFPDTEQTDQQQGVSGTQNQGYIPLVELPGSDSGDSDFGSYVNSIIKLAIGLAGVLAVVMLVIGGIQYMVGGASPSSKEAAKKRIWAAIFGLILALASFIILNTINPDLTKIKLDLGEVVLPTSSSETEGGAGEESGRWCLEISGGINIGTGEEDISRLCYDTPEECSVEEGVGQIQDTLVSGCEFDDGIVDQYCFEYEIINTQTGEGTSNFMCAYGEFAFSDCLDLQDDLEENFVEQEGTELLIYSCAEDI